MPKDDKKPTKKPSKTSAKKAAAARTNGKKGGRPPKHSLRGTLKIAGYKKILAEAGELPEVNDPIVLACWGQRILLRTLQLTLRGEGHIEMNREIRTIVEQVKKMIPLERQLLAERALERAATPQKPGRARGSRARRVAVKKKRPAPKKRVAPKKKAAPIATGPARR